MIIIPTRLKKACNYPGCSKLVKAGNTYCNQHRKQRHNDYTKIRDKKKMKFYSDKRWISLRNRKIANNPLCENCKEEGKIKAATEVHHIITIDKDWSKRFDYNNLMSLCHSCHMSKH